jgi:hypothetical protein
MENIKAKIKNESVEIRQKIKHQFYSYIAAAFGLVAGLAWNEAIKALIDYAFPLGKNTLWAKFGYAGFMTLVVVLISIYLARVLKSDDK